jgi:hypothetical protein
MMYRFTACLFICTLVFLASCTGTTAETEPIFVIAGVDDVSPEATVVPGILVLQDRVFEEIGQDEPRFVRFTTRDLGATARAFDTVDRAGTREELAVLSRTVTETRTETGTIVRTVNTFLDFFNTRGLVTANPDTFSITRNRVDLKALTYPAPLTADTLCPIDMEVTRNGSHALIFSSPSVCFPGSPSADDAIIIIALPARFPSTTPASVISFIRSFDVAANPLVRTSIFPGDVSRGGMYLDQSGDALYYLRQRSSQTVELRQLSFSAYTSTTPESGTNNVQVISSNIPIRPDEFRDMTRVSSNISILGASTYVLAPTSGTNVTTTTVTTLPVRLQDPRAFVPDPSANRLFILDDNDKIIYHTDPTNQTNTDTDITTGSVSTINTASSYLYVAGNDVMNIVDALPLNEGNTNIDSLLSDETCTETPTSGVCELNNPTALTWAEGILLPE